MAHFVERVAGNVLAGVAIQILQRKLIVVLGSVRNSSQLRILLPEISFDQFRGRQQSKDCCIASREPRRAALVALATLALCALRLGFVHQEWSGGKGHPCDSEPL